MRPEQFDEDVSAGGLQESQLLRGGAVLQPRTVREESADLLRSGQALPAGGTGVVEVGEGLGAPIRDAIRSAA